MQNIKETRHTIRTWSFSVFKSPCLTSIFYSRIYKTLPIKSTTKKKIKASWNYANFIPSASFAFSGLEAECLQHGPEQTEPSANWIPTASLPSSPACDTVTWGSWHRLKCEHPTTIELENHPTPLEVEKLRHRRVKWLTDSCTIQERK